MRYRFSLADLAIFLAAAIVAVVGYKYSPLLLAKADVTIAAPADCDLNRQGCRVDLPDGGHVDLAFAVRPVPVMTSFRVDASISGVDADSVEIDFAGASMNMGYNRKALAASGDGKFVGDAMIPVCTTGRMTWRATLLLTTKRQRIAVPFLFDAPIK